MKRIYHLLTCIFFIGCCTKASAQTLQATIKNFETKQPIADVSVFISNTSIGTTTNLNGEFILSRFPVGKFDLVISCIGYETKVINTTSSLITSITTIELKPKVKQLDEIVLLPYEKNGWEKWGNFFIEHFIGTTENSKSCVLKNKEAIKFRYNKKQNILSAEADETLLIENKALGYILKYRLTNFEFNFKTHIFYYQGYPLFEEMSTKKKGLQKRWNENRIEAYEGSLLHFMRSLYRNKLVQQGFEIRKIIKKENEEKKRVQTLVKNLILEGATVYSSNDDSSMYYKKVMRQPNTINYLINTILPGDSVAFQLDSTTAGFEFTDYLQVVYTKKKEPLAYANTQMRKPDNVCISEIHLPNAKGVAIFANGSYFNGTDLITSQYWAWSEKISNLLPLDFWPNQQH